MFSIFWIIFNRSSNLESNFYTIPIKDRTIKADVFPAGTDFSKFHDAMNLPEVIRIKNKILQDLAGKKILMSPVTLTIRTE